MAPASPARTRGTALLLTAVRVVMPALIAASGVLVLLISHNHNAQAVGTGLIGVSVMVVIANALMRLSLSSEIDREAEDEARRRFDRTGHWDDE